MSVKPSSLQTCLTQYDQLIKQFDQHHYNSQLLQSLIANFELNVLQSQRSIPFKQKGKLWMQLLFTRTSVSLKGDVKPTQVALWPVQFIHLDFLLPVYRSLLALNMSTVFVGIRPELKTLAAEHDIPYIHIEQQIRYGVFKSAFKRALNVLNILYTSRKLFPNDSVMNKALVRTLMNFQYYETYATTYPLVKQQLNPGYHLWGYEFSVACRPLNILANRDGLPTGNIQHGAINNNLLPYSICGQQFVWDQLTADIVHQACPQADVLVSGSPGNKHSEVEPIVHPELVSFIQSYETKFLVCFSGPGHNVTEAGHQQNLVALKEQIEANPEIGFIIKLHNKDKRGYYQSILEYQNVYMIDQQHPVFGQSILNLINVSNGIITGASTVAIETLLTGKPVISMDLKQELGHIAFLQSPMIVNCHTSIAFQTALSEHIHQTETFTKRLETIINFSQQHKHLHTTVAASMIAQSIQQQVSICAA